VTKKKRIMVIDDSEVILERIRRSLVAQGYDVIATPHPVGNARHLPTCNLVIIDYHMPGLDGSLVVASLRALASANKNECLIYLYTWDPRVAIDHAKLGFDGAFHSKGDEQVLARQVTAVFRRQAMKEAMRDRNDPEGGIARR
jgi:two-component system OmpR family response regulator